MNISRHVMLHAEFDEYDDLDYNKALDFLLMTVNGIDEQS